MIGNLKLSLHHIFAKIGFNFDILKEESAKNLDLQELKSFWEKFCETNGILKEGSVIDSEIKKENLINGINE